MDLNPTERRLIRIIRSQLDLYESQGQAHVAELISTHALELADAALTAERARVEAANAKATADLKAFAEGNGDDPNPINPATGKTFGTHTVQIPRQA